MMREVDAVPESRLQSLWTIGFHGEVKPTRTPGRREPIFSDEKGRLVRIERVGDPKDAAGTRTVWLKVGPNVSEGPLPGHATRFEAPLPAYLGYLVMVIGRDERAWASSLREIQPATSTPGLLLFLDWLASGNEAAPEGLRIQKLGEMVAWYCTPKEAYGFHQRIARIATDVLIQAARAKNPGKLYQASWWLSRAGLDDADQFLAAVGLEHSDPAIVDDFVKGVFQRKSVEEIQAGLNRARQLFQSLYQWSEPAAPRTTPNIGGLLRARRAHVRRADLVTAENEGNA